ncbi:hypothetical protein A3709_10310 [Halioglobus sp. HI00S01]|nr:hypothetical protein A3709_10310 [Halioglobus sp. HI00S01]
MAGSAALGAAGAGIGSALQKARNIRQAYQNGLAAGRNSNLSAQQAHALRRQLGADLKSQTPQPFRELIYRRNVAQYGDRLGPAFDPVRNANVTKTLTDTNAIADSILLLPGRGLGPAGAVAGGLAGGSSGDACGCN